MPALGERFRAAREARGLTLSDVAEHIRIRSVYLAAIEDENWTAIGAPVYIRGFPADLRALSRARSRRGRRRIQRPGLGAPRAGADRPRRAAARPAISPTSEPPARALSPLIWIASLVAVVLIAIVVYNEATLHARQSAGGTSF